MKRIKLGLPKGSLENATLELFAKSGWKISVNSRSY
ncbi:MAG: ATP phosphoribosyltransferase, partial [candidate division NC10 bacterium]|nr:ATP phosphoribosyltransferase [candidate division NC10 bacterium]